MSSGAPAAKRRGRPPGVKNRATIEREEREAREREAHERRASELQAEIDRLRTERAEAEAEAEIIPISVFGPQCVWVLEEAVGESEARVCQRRAWPGRPHCLAHVQAQARSDLADLVADSEQDIVEAQVRLRGAALGAVATLQELTGPEFSPNVRMKSAQVLVEASGASLARTGPQTVVVAGSATLLEGNDKVVTEAARIIGERLERLAAVGVEAWPAPLEGAVTLREGPDGTWSA